MGCVRSPGAPATDIRQGMHISPRPGSIDGVTNPAADSARDAGPHASGDARAIAPASESARTTPARQIGPGNGIAAIVLAAGASTRLGEGRSKQLLRYQGRTLLRHSVEQALASSCRPVVVVLGAEVERCRRELDGLDVHVTINPSWAEGMGSSIRAGMSALAAAAPDARAVVITLCDQPLVTGAFIDRLVQRYLTEAEGGGSDAAGNDGGVGGVNATSSASAADRELTIAAEYQGRPGVPALFPRSRFAELSRLDGAAGARHLLRGSAAPERASSHVVTLPCPEAAVDVDTITDYEALPQ
jgi:molybdenum cofactor cytidylyltransferase